jgi:hypothetical protein
MARRRNPDTDSSTPATPTTPDPLQAAPSAPRGRAADGFEDAVARPTPGPAPLPRAPVAPRGEPRLERARPGRRADAPSENAVTKRLEKLPVEPTPAPLPPSPAAADAERWFEQIPTNPGAPRRDPSAVREAMRTPAGGVPTTTPPSSPSNLLIALIVATALAVGMVLGALLFSYRGTAKCPPCAGGSSAGSGLGNALPR